MGVWSWAFVDGSRGEGSGVESMAMLRRGISYDMGFLELGLRTGGGEGPRSR
jgi:hypothetical protein